MGDAWHQAPLGFHQTADNVPMMAIKKGTDTPAW